MLFAIGSLVAAVLVFGALLLPLSQDPKHLRK